MNRAHVFDLTNVDAAAITDFIGSVVVDEDGAQWIYVKNNSATTIALYNFATQDTTSTTFGVAVINPTSGAMEKIIGVVQHTAILQNEGGWVKRTGDVELSVYNAGALSVGTSVKPSAATAGIGITQTADLVSVGYLVDAHSVATAAETLTVRSSLVPFAAPR